MPEGDLPVLDDRIPLSSDDGYSWQASFVAPAAVGELRAQLLADGSPLGEVRIVVAGSSASKP